MELCQLRAFIAVMDTGSLVTASRALRISRTTLSSRIGELEESLGAPLMVRTHRGMLATDFARCFADDARALLREADALTRAALSHREEVVGTLELRGAVGLPPELLMTLVSELARRHPELTLRAEARHDAADERAGEVDVILHFGPRVPAGPYRTFALGRFPERLIASRGYLESRGRPGGVEALAEHRLMRWCGPGEDGASLPLLGGGSLAIAPFFVSDQIGVLRSLAAAGRGIALVPDLTAFGGGAGAGEDLEVVLGDQVGREATLWVLIPEARANAPRSRAAVGLLREMARSLAAAGEGARASEEVGEREAAVGVDPRADLRGRGDHGGRFVADRCAP